MVTLTGQNTVVETSAPDVDILRCGMEVWGDLTLCGTGSLVATGSQCGIYVSGTLAVDGCKVDARADGSGIADARVAGVIADGHAVRGGGRVVAAARAPEQACAPMACICRSGLPAVARLDAVFLLMPHGSMWPPSTAALLARVGRLCPHGL